jgi:general L-amino acid transport system substrate-binding protein
MLKRAVLALAAILVLAVTAARADTLHEVKKRGYLACGSILGRAGFGLPDGHGHWAGLDIDFCRALAAAIFDDAGKVKFVTLTAKDRSAPISLSARSNLH